MSYLVDSLVQESPPITPKDLVIAIRKLFGFEGSLGAGFQDARFACLSFFLNYLGLETPKVPFLKMLASLVFQIAHGILWCAPIMLSLKFGSETRRTSRQEQANVDCFLEKYFTEFFQFSVVWCDLQFYRIFLG